jgi:hypothetical protein
MIEENSIAEETPELEAAEVDIEQKIAARAHELWIERGCPLGSPEEDWFRAEQEIRPSAAELTTSA